MESAQPSNANNKINTRTQVPCLRDLNLADNMLGDDGVEGVAAGLAGHPCLEALVLDGNDVGLDGTASLCESLLQNASLRTLSLRRNSLLADSAEVIAGSFFCFVWLHVRTRRIHHDVLGRGPGNFGYHPWVQMAFSFLRWLSVRAASILGACT